MTGKFPVDAPRAKVLAAHIAMVRDNADGTATPLSIPAHRTIKGSTLRTICTQARIPREEFLAAYGRAR
jgi:hypothetical protein